MLRQELNAHGSELAVPDRDADAVVEFGLALICPCQLGVLLGCALGNVEIKVDVLVELDPKHSSGWTENDIPCIDHPLGSRSSSSRGWRRRSWGERP